MDRFINEERRPYTDLATVESQRNELTSEEFPEGPYGSGMRVESLGKSKPWRIDQRSQKAYDYENHMLHDELSRDYAGEDDYGDGDSIPEVLDEP
ncbi:hypothetical protein KP806_09925 [Paenibacillus sp. N4]|uniref:hypothetical protein n=1 Tax=Paenibacillus vietnamensis TaxID=2590547 RepID=UPI001CD1329B|nr:hypothetical protein [Paenibacillus vietnamensis]MCA0755369.1 hypothetical protein [Paenibacillus vietnamensis]